MVAGRGVGPGPVDGIFSEADLGDIAGEDGATGRPSNPEAEDSGIEAGAEAAKSIKIAIIMGKYTPDLTMKIRLNLSDLPASQSCARHASKFRTTALRIT